MNEHERFRIERIIEHNKRLRTFFFDMPLPAMPGQFYMAWIPGIDEKPFSASGPQSITVRQIGDFTAELFRKQEGDDLYLRGPYGNGFPIRDNAVAIGGGCGLAPLAHLLAVYALQRYLEPALSGFVMAARDASELFCLEDAQRYFRRYAKDPEENLIKVTEDGSLGFKGIATVAPIPEGDAYYICGPERMMAAIAEGLVGRGVHPSSVFLSIERYMKCAIGECGVCDFDGYRVCSDGPVFSYATILDARERLPHLDHFTKLGRMKTGELVPLDK
jgi:dihydroorotate dehydrogenase electron transfer subunit